MSIEGLDKGGTGDSPKDSKTGITRRSTHDRNGLREHDLIRRMGMQIQR